MQEVIGSKLAPVPAEVVKVINETPDTKTFYFKPKAKLENPRPGQFTEIYIPGVGEAPVSVSGTGPDGVIIQTIRSIGTLTEYLFKLGKGDLIGIRGPYGKGWPIEKLEGRDILIIGGGIGLAPLRPVIKAVEKDRSRYGRLSILYGARTPSLLLYKYEFEEYREIPNSELLLTVDHADETWTGNVGVVTKLIPKASVDPENAIALVCGPEIMMRFTVKALEERGFRENQIYISLERRMKCGVGL
ncbi:MAG: FAD/NAD(P)-binding protein, partial [Thaumarchaeota archaeon]|nr:FAD/NAD(P)-binding protein [Nitrososphaerota archaeon]